MAGPKAAAPRVKPIRDLERDFELIIVEFRMAQRRRRAGMPFQRGAGDLKASLGILRRRARY